ncbi:MAG: ABC transporter permease [Planctomycetota bacterium]
MYPVFLSLRYLVRRRVNLLSILAVAVGVMTLIVVLSVMKGFDRDLRERIRGTLSHLTVRGREDHTLTDYDALVGRIRSVPHVVAAAPYIEHLAVIRTLGFPGYWDWVVVKGIDFPSAVAVGDLRKYFVEPGIAGFRWDDPARAMMEDHQADHPRDGGATGAFVGKELARSLNLARRDEFTLGIPIGGEGFENDRFRYVATVFSKSYEVDSRHVFIPLARAQQVFEMRGRVRGIEVKLDNYRNAPRVRERLAAVLGPDYTVETWEERKRDFLEAVRIERRVMAVILGFILLVAGFGIVAVLRLMVMEKTRDIGILLAIGATTDGVLVTFLLTGFWVGIFGTAAGFAAGFLFLQRLMNPLADAVYRFTNFRIFPPETYYLGDSLPYEIDPMLIGCILAAAVGMSFLAALYPAARAARLKPVDALRYE